jgi:hypothetical protein
MDYIKLFPKIHVYKNLLPKVDGLVDILKKSEEDPTTSYLFKDWKPWSFFGTYVYQIDNDIVHSGIQDKKLTKEIDYLEMVKKAFFDSTDNFLKEYNLDVPEDWQLMGPSFSRYTPDEKQEGRVGKGMSMSRHTDYVPWMRGVPGYKFGLTCTMYLNDDYEGGEISFKIGKDYIDYKPVAGDVLVFPSGHPDFLSEDHPYLHGVKKIEGNSRYLIRCFYQFFDPGSKEWHEGKEKHGEELWGKMEDERIERDMKKYDFK